MAGSVFVEWKGGDAFARISSGASRGNARALEQLRAQSEPLVPVEFGTLVGSAAVEQREGGGDAFADGTVSYDTPYAVFVHEIERNKHATGQAHFLSDPLETEQAQLIALQAAEVRRAISG